MKPLPLPAGRVHALLGEPLLMVPQVADHLGVHRSTVYRLAGRPNGIPCVRVGESLRFRPEDVRSYMERQTLQVDGGDLADHLIAGMVAEGRPTAPIRRKTR